MGQVLGIEFKNINLWKVTGSCTTQFKGKRKPYIGSRGSCCCSLGVRQEKAIFAVEGVKGGNSQKGKGEKEEKEKGKEMIGRKGKKL